MSGCDLSVIIPTHGRAERLRSLLRDIAGTRDAHDRFEVIVIVDGRDDAPLEAAEALPDTIRMRGLTQDHAGPAAARNRGIAHAEGRWVLFYDDDARIGPDTIPGHLQRIDDDPDAVVAHLGRVDPPATMLRSPWDHLVHGSSMMFFWGRMTDGGRYGYRHFWTSNLSVRTELVRDAGGFNESFPSPMHEDIELGWRLARRFGLSVRVDMSIHSLHDHPVSPRDYLRREHTSGRSARAARTINRPFHDAIWSWVGGAHTTLRALEQMFLIPARTVLHTFEQMTAPSDDVPDAAMLDALYHAHLPLKRMAFLHGYLNQPFEDFWTRLHDA